MPKSIKQGFSINKDRFNHGFYIRIGAYGLRFFKRNRRFKIHLYNLKRLEQDSLLEQLNR